MFKPDPLSVPWETPMPRILDRVYAARGEWIGTRIVDPPLRHLLFAERLGININGRDTAAGRKARTRWARAFIRALERENKARGGRPIEWEVGRRIPASPSGSRPAGRAVRIRTRQAGYRAIQAVQRKPDSERIYDDDGNPAGRWADPDLRDW